MTIKLEVNEERTQRDLSEEEWSFPIWRWAAFSLFDTLILVSPLTRELIYPGGSDSRSYLGKSFGNLMLDDTQRFIFIIIILTLLLPAFALIVESLLFSKGYLLLSMICSCLIFVSATVLFVYSLSIVPDFWSITIYSYMLYLLFNIVSYLRKINRNIITSTNTLLSSYQMKYKQSLLTMKLTNLLNTYPMAYFRNEFHFFSPIKQSN